MGFFSELFLEQREGRGHGLMLRYHSKKKETTNRRADIITPEVNGRIQLLEKRNTLSPASLTVEFNTTLEERTFNKSLKAAVFRGTWEEGEMVVKVTQGIWLQKVLKLAEFILLKVLERAKRDRQYLIDKY